MCATTKYVSVICQSNGTTAVITPLMPPITNWNTNASANSIGVLSTMRPYQIVASHAKICTALGIETVIDAAPEKLIDSCGMPTANMWCTHTPNPTRPVTTVASATNVWPTIGRRLNVGMTIDSMPVAGRNTMYTQGWPNTQNRCCQSNGEPPRCTSKKMKCQCRSSSSMPRPTVSGGIAKIAATDIVSELQRNKGIRSIDMPGARILSIVTIELHAPAVVEMPKNSRPSA